MPIAGAKLAQLLSEGRKLVDTVFARLVELGSYDPNEIPCTAILAYTTIRQRQAQTEAAVFAEIKAKGMHPPEGAPRSQAIVSSCQANQVNAKVPPEATTSGKAYLLERAKKKKAQIAAITKKYGEDASFKALIDSLLAKMSAQGNMTLVLPYFTVGGELWPAEETGKFMISDFDSVTEPMLTASNVEATRTKDAVEALAALKRPLEAKRKWVWPVLIGLGTVAGVGAGLWYLKGKEGEMDDGAEDELEARPERLLPPHRGRSPIDVEFTEVTG